MNDMRLEPGVIMARNQKKRGERQKGIEGEGIEEEKLMI